MSSTKTSKILGIVLVVLLIGAVCMRLSLLEPAKPPPSAPGYYTGPMRGKGGQNRAATEDGKVIDLPPPDTTQSETKPLNASPKKTDSPATGTTP